MKFHTQPEGQSSTDLSPFTVLAFGSDTTIRQVPKYIYEQNKLNRIPLEDESPS